MRPLSFVQRRLWMADVLAAPGALNLPLAMAFDGPLDLAALEHAIAEVARRHEVLRTTYRLHEGEPHPQVEPPGDVRLTLVDFRALAAADRDRAVSRVLREEAHRPFDLARDAPIRACLLRCAAEAHVLSLTRHHIASDGWSLGILLRELAFVYERYWSGEPSPLPELRMQYADYAAWERGRLTDETVAEQLTFWREQLRDCRPESTLGDRVDHRGPIDGAVECRAMPQDLSEQAIAACRRLAVTRFMFACAACIAVLHHRTGETDLVVGTDVSCRTTQATEALIGCFINRVPLRVDASGDPTVRELVQRVKRVTIAAHAHADVPFDRIVSALNPERPAAGEPLFQVMFGVHPAPAHAPYWTLVLHRMRAQRLIDCPNESSQFPLSLYLTEGREGWVIEARFDARRFARSAMRVMLAQLEESIRVGIEDPDTPLHAVTARLAEVGREASRRSVDAIHARRRATWSARRAPTGGQVR
jgi:hypothetical protein